VSFDRASWPAAADLRYPAEKEAAMRNGIRLAFVALFLFGCGSSGSGAALDFNGQYTGTSTNGASTCPGTWNTGQTADGAVNLVQSGSDIQFQAQGGTGLVFLAVFGSSSFTGRASGSHVDAVIVGSVATMQGACTYTWKGTISADLAGDTLTGKLTYTPNSNGHADCDALKVTGCTRVTDFTYSRPPK
jgi:hypothetical protein